MLCVIHSAAIRPIAAKSFGLAFIDDRFSIIIVFRKIRPSISCHGHRRCARVCRHGPISNVGRTVVWSHDFILQRIAGHVHFYRRWLEIQVNRFFFFFFYCEYAFFLTLDFKTRSYSDHATRNACTLQVLHRWIEYT